MLASGRRAATSRRVLLATPCTITVRAPTGTSCARSVNACDISNRGDPIAPGVALEVPSLLEALRFPNLTRAFVAIPVRRGDAKREDVKDPSHWDQLWAEGLVWLGDGGSIRIPEDLAPAAKDFSARLVSALSRYCR